MIISIDESCCYFPTPSPHLLLETLQKKNKSVSYSNNYQTPVCGTDVVRLGFSLHTFGAVAKACLPMNFPSYCF